MKQVFISLKLIINVKLKIVPVKFNSKVLWYT